MLADVNVILFSDVGLTLTILEKEGLLVHVKAFNLAVIGNIPVNDEVKCRRLLNSDTNSVRITTSGHILDKGVLLILVNIQAHL